MESNVTASGSSPSSYSTAAVSFISATWQPLKSVIIKYMELKIVEHYKYLEIRSEVYRLSQKSPWNSESNINSLSFENPYLYLNFKNHLIVFHFEEDLKYCTDIKLSFMLWLDGGVIYVLFFCLCNHIFLFFCDLFQLFWFCTYSIASNKSIYLSCSLNNIYE